MIVWGKRAKQRNIGELEHHPCQVCGTTKPFQPTLVYNYFHIYWIFRYPTDKQYWLVCQTCANGRRVEESSLAAPLDRSPIPLWDQYGLLVAGGVFLAFVAYAIVTETPSARRAGDGLIASAGTVDAFQLRVGDCFNDNPNVSLDGPQQLGNVPGVPCSEPHDNEVFAVLNLDEQRFPGADAIFEMANSACLEQFEAFAGIAYESSVLDVTTLYPTEQSWSRRGDREVVCAVYHIELEKLVGTMKGRGI